MQQADLGENPICEGPGISQRKRVVNLSPTSTIIPLAAFLQWLRHSAAVSMGL